jgi:hypothetical protein
MQRHPCKYGIAVVFLFFAALCFGQDIQIVHAEGGEFAFTSQGRRSVYQPGAGLENTGLHREDIIQTGPGSFVELRVNPGGGKIKIAENTSLVYNGAGIENGSISFSILYGRMRLSTAGTWPMGEGSAVFIQSGNAEAVFRRGDAGVDFIVNTAESYLTRGEPVLRVYAFSGNAELIPTARPTASGIAPRFQVHEQETVSIEILNPLSYIERRPLDESIIDYWNRHNFSGGAPLLSLKRPEVSAPPPPPPPPPQEAPPPPAEPAEPQVIEKTVIEYRSPDYSHFFTVNRVKNAFILTGSVFLLGGVAMQSVSSYRLNGIDDRTAEILWNYGYAPLGLGLLFLGGAAVINPRTPPESDAAK